ncbi:MAG: sigma-70 family RNA polymerase sigma factor [Planctomycetota bacterium]|nr:sigma-70 family RNA polymerase sigma factor [Planctomycetota bacterium]
MLEGLDSMADFETRIRNARNDGSAARADFLAAYRAYLRYLARDGIGKHMQAKVDASDLAQDVIVAAQRDFPSFRGETEAELMAWLRRMLANRIVDYARKYGGTRRQAQERSIHDILYESSMAFESVLAASGLTPSQNAEKRELATILADALEQLSPDHQEVLLLRTKESLSWNEVAQRMGRRPDAARQLWVRALKALKPLLKKRL